MKNTINKIAGVAKTGICRFAVALMLGLGWACGAWAATPVAVWDGDFSTMTKGTYTISENGNTKTDSYLQISGNNGILLTSTDALNVFTVIMRCSGLNLDSANKQVLFTSYGAEAATASGINDNLTGVYLLSNNTNTKGIWSSADWGSESGATKNPVPANYTTLIYNHQQTGGTYAYALGPTSDVNDTVVRTTLYSVGGLRSSGTTYKGFAVGGLRGTTNATLLPATGLKITSLAIFSSTLSEAEMKSYLFPSEIQQITVNADTSVSAINAQFDSVNYKVISVLAANGVTITVDAPFDKIISVSSEGNVTLAAASQPAASYFSNVDFSGVEGALRRSWLTSNVVGFNFRSNKGDDVSGALVTADKWVHDSSFASGTSTAMFADGLSTLAWSSATTWYYSSGTFLNGYLDDGSNGGNGATITLSNVPYVAYDVIVYCSTDSSGNFLAKTVNGTTYTWDSSAGKVIKGNAAWGSAPPSTPSYGDNALRIKNLSGPLTIYGTARNTNSRGGIAAFQIINTALEATIASAGEYTLAGLFGSTLSEDCNYVINVNESATLNLNSAVSVGGITFNVAEGKTLTLTGNNTITAANGIYVKGGTVAMTSSLLRGTVYGNGTLYYNGVRPTTSGTDVVLTDSKWHGTVRITYNKENTATSTERALFPQHWGSANSKIKWNGVAGYFGGCTSTAGWILEDLTVDATTYPALRKNDGSSGGTTTAPSLEGDGEFCDESNPSERFHFTDGSAFEGKITITSAAGNGMNVQFGADAVVKSFRTIHVLSGASVKVASGKTWRADGGIVVSGTLTLEDSSALSGRVSGSGTVVCNQVDLSGTGFDNASGWTGKVQIAGDTVMQTTYFDESAYGNASSTLEVVSGHVAITAATSLPGTVNVASGATLYMKSSSITDLAISGTNSGTINLSMASGITTLTLGDGIARGTGTIVYPSSLTALNLTLKENLADDTEVVLDVSGGTTLTAATVTMYKPDGITVNDTAVAEVSADGRSITVTYTPTVSGNACWIDYEMDYDESASKTGFENTGTDRTSLSSDTIDDSTYTAIIGSDAFTDHGMLYTYAHPYRNGLGTLPDNWTAVVRCTVPNYENAAVITFGWYDSMIGLVAGPNPETDMLLIKTSGNSQFETLATMKVEDATTAQHVYIFSVENRETIKVYCDGRPVLNRTFDPFTLTSGFQVGSALGGVHGTGVVRFGKSESPANTLDETVQKDARIDCVRLYKSVLGANAIRQLSAEFPSVELYKATIAADATTTWGDLAWENDKTWSGGNIYSKIILTVEGDASLTLPSTITAEDFQINVASGYVLTLNRPAGGTTITTTNPMEINNGTMYLADDTSLGTWEIAGTGTVRLRSGAMVTGALSGTAKIEIPSGSSVVVMGGSIANTITGSGALGYITALPASPLSFDGWTGAVALNQAIADGAINFNDYGCSGSKIQLAGMSGGYLVSAEVLPEVELLGDMTLAYFSASFVNTIDKLSGTGGFSLTADGSAQGYADGYFLIKDVSAFTGSITVVAPGLALGGTSKPSSTTWYGNIVVQAPVTVGAGATWTADGVVLSDTTATLTVPDGATVPTVKSGVAGYKVATDTTTIPGSTIYKLVVKGAFFMVY